MKTLQQLGEFGLIDRIRQLLPPAPPSLLVGPGDDAAVWQPTPGQALVLTCDCAVEGRHFPSLQGQSLETIEWFGWRSAHMNLSDIAAMAGVPRFALVALALPLDCPVDRIEALYRGMVRGFNVFDVAVAGGNITSTPGPLILHVTLGGEVTPGQAALRTGSQPGDHIGVTGYPGHAGAGLHAWLSQTPLPPDTQVLVDAYLQPHARVQEGRTLAPHIHAMADISDGLLLDLSHLLEPANLGAILDQDKLPIHPLLRAYTQHLKQPPYHFMFSASDDYELLFTAPPDAIPTLEQAYSSLPDAPPLHWIGTVTSEPGIKLQTKDGQLPLTAAGWNHFSQE